MKENYREAFTEIIEIFKLMPITMINKIPNNFIKMIEENMSKTYIPNISEPLENCNLKNETKAILYLIYRDFLCDEKEKRELKYRDEQKAKSIKRI